ncbi:MAG: AAA family ATPase [Ignavibacteria bacterium]|nr:AAA family ATPase [Ignavibacteria bacterium]
MRINKLFIDNNITKDFGLKPIRLENIGKVVAFFGKNGSGKSRILDQLSIYIRNISAHKIYSDYFSNLPNRDDFDISKFEKIYDLLKLETELEEVKYLLTIHSEDTDLKRKLSIINSQIMRFLQTDNSEFKDLIIRKENFDQSITNVINNYVNIINIDELLKIESELSKNDNKLTNLLSHDTFAYLETEDELIKQGMMHYLAVLANKLALSKLICKNSDELKSDKTYRDYKMLSEIISELIGHELKHEIDRGNLKADVDDVGGIKGRFRINNREINLKEYSPGQKILLAFCFYLFIKGKVSNAKLKDKIFIIDELETHLHPEVQILLIEKLKEIIGDTGQLWMATHSINILSHLNLDEIYLVENGEIKIPGSIIPEKAYNALMGNNTNVLKLNNFVLDISNWAFSNFMIQCFDDPSVIISPKPNDPQIELFKNIFKNEKRIRILDYGSGKGRLYKEISKDKRLDDLVDYAAVDQNKENINYLRKIGIQNSMKDIDLLIGFEFDIIIMMNVLHEVDINKWENIFKSMHNKLNDNGLLVILEDKFIPNGEMPNKIGFLILGLEELQKLFDLKELPSSIVSKSSKYEDRLLCALISKNQIANVNRNTITSSIQCLKNNSFQKIDELRENKNIEKIKKGHLSALYTQLYVNSIFALRELS